MGQKMTKAVWDRMERAMRNGGFKVVHRIHNAVSQDVKDRVFGQAKKKFPHLDFEHKIYTDHRGYVVLFVKEKQEKEVVIHPETSYEENIITRLEKQNRKGLDKYGMTLAQNSGLGIYERMDHLAEELTDGLMYIEHIKALADTHIEEVQGIISQLMTTSNKSIITREEIRQIGRELNDSIKGLIGQCS